MAKKIYDFSGYATKNDLECSDGRIIRKDAFKHQDGVIVPLVWQHKRDGPLNVLGKALLENRPDGVYAYVTFNDSAPAKDAKLLVQHGDITALSIRANKLVQQVNSVIHGFINELSLVVTGANPGARIDELDVVHSDDYGEEFEAIISTGEAFLLEHADASMDAISISKTLTDIQSTLLATMLDDIRDGIIRDGYDNLAHSEETMDSVFKTLNDDQVQLFYAMIGNALAQKELDDSAKHSGDDPEADVDPEVDPETVKIEVEHEAETDSKTIIHDDMGGNTMKRNVFDATGNAVELKEGMVLTHEMMDTIITTFKETGSFAKAILEHAGTYGIDDVDILFPDATTLANEPTFVSREMGWVAGVINGTHHSPFSRIKTVSADITADEARAKGYVTGSEKTEEVFGLLSRVTTPTTIYKKQALDREDIVDITSLNVVAWMKKEMRIMLNEEIARAILIGDGRSAVSPDKVKTDNIRPIYLDADLYSHKIIVETDATVDSMIESIIRSKKFYKGIGGATMYSTADFITDLLLLKDTTGRRIYRTLAELAAELRVSNIIEVEAMEGAYREVGDDTRDLLAIIVNLKDYNIGADKGGEVSMFDDFDIDFNKYKYLMETRISGALTRPKAAIVVEQTRAAG